MASFRVTAGSVNRIGNKVSMTVRFRSTDTLRTSPAQYFEVDATTVRAVEEALKDSAREWDRRSVTVAQAPSLRTGVEVDTEEAVEPLI